jgi:hypothetical protein
MVRIAQANGSGLIIGAYGTDLYSGVQAISVAGIRLNVWLMPLGSHSSIVLIRHFVPGASRPPVTAAAIVPCVDKASRMSRAIYQR